MLPYFKHQLRSIQFFQKRDRGLDTSDPGTGKTRVQIAVFTQRRLKGSGAALIIAPRSLLRSAWEDDFKKFAPDLVISVAEADKRESAFEKEADVYIINTDGVRWLIKQPDKFFTRFSTLIIDEISYFKHRTSQRSKALGKIKKHFKFRYGLTGTPTANTILDIWHPLLLIDDGARLGKSFYSFRQAVCTAKQVGPVANMIKWEDKPGAVDSVGALIRDITIRHKFEECLDIPPNTEHVVQYHLAPKQLLAYRRMEKDQIVELVGPKGSAVVSAINAAAVTTKLLQIACICYDTPVLTARGWVVIQNVLSTDKVWDGEEWVTHGGSILKGSTEVIKRHGVWMTPEHFVLTNEGWCSGESSERFARADVRLPDGYQTSRHDDRDSDPMCNVGMSVCVWECGNTQESVPASCASDTSPQLRMPTWQPTPRNVQYAPVLQMGRFAQSLLQPKLQRLQKLGRTWHNSMQTMAQIVRELLCGYEPQLQDGAVTRSHKQQRRVQLKKLPVGDCTRTSKQYAAHYTNTDTERASINRAGSTHIQYQTSNTTCTTTSLRLDDTARIEPVYDLINCGPRTRFVVKDEHDIPLIVHNSGAVYGETGKALIDRGRYELVADLIEARAHCVVFFNWTHQRDYLIEEFEKREITYVVIDGGTSDKGRHEAVDLFQKGFYRVLLAHPASAGHGLTLTRATTTIWASPTYNLEHVLQGNRRIYRAGQFQRTETVSIVAQGTIDETVMSKIATKDTRQQGLLDILKERL